MECQSRCLWNVDRVSIEGELRVAIIRVLPADTRPQTPLELIAIKLYIILSWFINLKMKNQQTNRSSANACRKA